MSTQRPFFANFFGAFRARTSPAFQAKSSTPASSITPASLASAAHVSTTTTNATSAPKSISTQAQPEASSQSSQTSATVSSPVPRSSPSPFATATLTSTSPGSHFYGTHLPRSPGSSSPVPHNANLSMSPPGQSTPMTRGRQRRGSDSSNSSGGFMDALGSDKWYIGGRASGGEERFYRLGLVTGASGKRVQSLDRLSL